MSIKIIGVGCGKGGVGKTTLAELLASIAAEEYNQKGIHVVGIDSDQQASFTARVASQNPIGIDGQTAKFFNGEDFGSCAQWVTMRNQNYWFVASDGELGQMLQLDEDDRLVKVFDHLENQIDGDMLFIVDLPVGPNMIVQNWINVTDGLLIPSSPDKFFESYTGVQKLLALYDEYERYPITHNIVTRYKSRLLMHMEHEEKVRTFSNSEYAQRFSNGQGVTYAGHLANLEYSLRDPEIELRMLFNRAAKNLLSEVMES